MTARYHQLAFTPNVKAEQVAHGSRGHYAKYEGAAEIPDPITEAEAAFIGARDSFYFSTVGETGWPYVQHRGGPPGFVKTKTPSAWLIFGAIGSISASATCNSTTEPRCFSWITRTSAA